MENNKGFTLIELLVGLIVVGLISSLLIGIFGSPVQNASVQKASIQIQDHMRSVQDAVMYYTAQRTTEITSLADLTDPTKLNPPPLSIVPKAPPSAEFIAFSPFVGDVYAFEPEPSYGYTFVDADPTYSAWKNAGVNDTVIALPGVTAAICLHINQGQGMLNSDSTVADIPAVIKLNYKIFCWNNAGTYTVVSLLYPH